MDRVVQHTVALGIVQRDTTGHKAVSSVTGDCKERNHRVLEVLTSQAMWSSPTQNVNYPH